MHMHGKVRLTKPKRVSMCNARYHLQKQDS